MKKLLSFLIVVSIMGCSSTPSIKEMTTRMGSTNNIEITDMRNVVRNGLLTAQVTIKNDSSSNLVSYRFKWLGKGGMTVFEDEAWKPIIITKGQSASINGIAPTPDAIDFRFELNQLK
jgi:uncharacterized protein YcfL